LIDNDNSDNDGDDEDDGDDKNDDDSPCCGCIGGCRFTFDGAHHDHRDGGGRGDVVGVVNDDGNDAAARTPTTGTPMTTTRTTEMTQYGNSLRRNLGRKRDGGIWRSGARCNDKAS
jgi:hypothetical protein